MLDRIDIHIDVPAVKAAKIVSEETSSEESSKKIRDRILKARQKQSARFLNSKLVANSDMGNRDIKDLCEIDNDAKEILKQALLKLSLSARAYHKVIKIAQTIADLDAQSIIQRHHVLEALQYRPRIDVL
jgi:magnesium chelatase family protein